MPLEDITAGSTIADLDLAHPASSDPRSQAPLIFANIKKALQYTFPNISATVNAAASELDFAAVGGTASGTCIFKSQAEFLSGYKASGSATTVLAQGIYQGRLVYQIDSDYGLQQATGRDYPILLNSSFDIRQGLSGTYTLASSDVYVADGWTGRKSSSASLVAFIETSDVPAVSLLKTYVPAALRVRAAIPVTSPGATNYGFLTQPIEGTEYRRIAQRPWVLTFAVKSSALGTHNVWFAGGGNYYLAEYEISATGTWTYIETTVPASPSTGTWDYSTGEGIRVGWTLYAGSGYRIAPGSWGTSEGYLSTAGVNVMSATDAYLTIAAPCLAPGVVGQRYSAEPYNAALSRARRYYNTSYGPGAVVGAASAPAGAIGCVGSSAVTANEVMAVIEYPERMRIAPTVTFYNPVTGTAGFFESWASSHSYTATTTLESRDRFTLQKETAAATGGQRYYIHYVANARL